MSRRRLGEDHAKRSCKTWIQAKQKQGKSIRFENTPHDDDDGESLAKFAQG